MTGCCNTVGLNSNTTVLGLVRIRSPWRSRPDNRGRVLSSDKQNDGQTDIYGETVTDRQTEEEIDEGRKRENCSSQFLPSKKNPPGAINNPETREKLMYK